ncbi:MAG TPA: chromate resistance protein ChrB domain-containing protein [Steroidobacteraceae bacterium]
MISNLPGRNATVRMRMWRALKSAGAGMMRDGAYVLPMSDHSRKVFEEQSAEIKDAGGLGHIVAFEATSPAQHESIVLLFDRTAEYAGAKEALDALKGKLPKLEELAARQELATVAREVADIVTRDFFPGESRKQMEGALTDAESAINARFSPDEPSAVQRSLSRRDISDYRGRNWATREHLWIDRVASAWLIRRFIDPDAKFLWLKKIKDCPKGAVGFDFDAAEFTHIGSKVTFEVLVASFDLERDAGLVRLGALVHHLDVGGIPVAEGPGLTTIMTGTRALQKDDDALLTAMTPVFDALYAGYVIAKT